MGSYAVLNLRNYQLENSYRNLEPYILQLFQENELKVENIKKSKNKIIECSAFYETKLSYVAQRLKIIGHSAKMCRAVFYDEIIHEVDTLKKIYDNVDKKLKLKLKTDIQLLEKSSYDDFTNALNILVNQNIDVNNKEKYKGKNEYCKFLLADEHSIFNKLPCPNLYSNLIYLHEAHLKEEKINYNFSSLIDYDNFEFTVQLAYSLCMESEDYGYKFGEKIIILTEGSTDIQVLKIGLELLYPELADYYYFMDFHASNSPGSTSALVNNIKAFIGTRIKTKIIAVFDNDTAGREAISTFEKIQMQDNIKLLTLPYLKMAEKYPTLGPTGLNKININGLACSIELYLSDKFIKDNGAYIPIQWQGYNEKLKSYQGVILTKDKIRNNFLDYCKKQQTDNKNLLKSKFVNLDLIYQDIFNAFDMDFD